MRVSPLRWKNILYYTSCFREMNVSILRIDNRTGPRWVTKDRFCEILARTHANDAPRETLSTIITYGNPFRSRTIASPEPLNRSSFCFTHQVISVTFPIRVSRDFVNLTTCYADSNYEDMFKTLYSLVR